MKRKEAIVRYLAHVERANRREIAQAIKASIEITAVRLTELKRVGIVRNAEWPDGSKLWFLTEQGERRFQYYRRRGE